MVERTDDSTGRPVIQVALPEDVYERLRARVETLDTSIQDWVTTVIIEGLERVEALPPGLVKD